MAQSPWFSNPINPVTTNPTNYRVQHSSYTPMGAIIDQIGLNLKAAKPFSNQLSYEQYAAPQREAFNIWEQQMYRPEFEQYTLNPWEQRYGRQAAGANFAQLGGAPQMYEQQRRQIEQPYYNQLEQARQSYENMTRGGYEQRMRNYYESPISFTRFNK